MDYTHTPPTPGLVQYIQQQHIGSVKDNGVWSLDSKSVTTDRLSSLQQKHIPSKVHDSIAARIDDLPPNAALTLKVLASIGREGSFVLLEHVFPWEAFQEYGFVEHELGIHSLEEQDTLQTLADAEAASTAAAKGGEGTEKFVETRHQRATSFGSLLRGETNGRARGRSFDKQKEPRTESILVRRAEKIISILRILVQECFIDVGLIMGHRGKGSPERFFGKPENEVSRVALVLIL